MSDIVPISKSRHASSGWLQPPNYTFASKMSSVPVVVDEIAKAMLTLTLAFRRHRDASGKVGYELVAVLSPVKERNLFVKPDGSWLSGYIPACLKAYPFRLTSAPDTGQSIVCFDQGSGLMTEFNAPNSQPFFTENGEPGPAFTVIVENLQRYELRRVQTQKAVDSLAEHHLITPWSIGLATDNGKTKRVPGLFRVNAEKLQKLAAEPMHKLQQCGALAIVYAQLMSEQHMQTFGELMRVQGELHKKNAESVTLGNIEALFGNKSDTLNFDKF